MAQDKGGSLMRNKGADPNRPKTPHTRKGLPGQIDHTQPVAGDPPAYFHDKSSGPSPDAPDRGGRMWGKSITLTRLAGFDIKLDASWFLIAGLIIWSLATGYFPEMAPDAGRPVQILAATIAMLGLFTSLVLHELAHSVVARAHGLPISGITLFLFGGVAELEGEPPNPQVEIRVAIVGPLASVALAALFWAATLAATALGLAPIVTALLQYLATINLALALFNLLPALPLDGGRVYRAWLWRRDGDLWQATRRAAGLSALVAWGMIGLGTLAALGGGLQAGLWPILVGLFLLAMGQATLRQAEIEHLLGARRVADLMTRDPVLTSPDQTLSEVVNRVFLAQGVSFAPVVEDGVLLGYIDLPLIRRIERENWGTTSVDDVIEGLSDKVAVPSDMPVRALLALMARTGRGKYLVVDGTTLKGIVTMRDVADYLDISARVADLR
jgi:Zn-dependent protease/predicted transcriptional regulator